MESEPREGDSGEREPVHGWLRRQSVWGETPKEAGRRSKREDNEVYYSSVEGTQETRASSVLAKADAHIRDLREPSKMSDTL